MVEQRSAILASTAHIRPDEDVWACVAMFVLQH
jgi:hypothetical protein